MIWLAVILFVATLTIDLVTDYKIWLNNHKTIDHDRGTWLRAIGLVPAIILFTLSVGWSFPYWLIASLISFLVVGFNYWNLFDGIFNLLRGYSWLFTGSDDPDDSKSDNFLQSISLTEHILLKLGGSVVFILLYIFIT